MSNQVGISKDGVYTIPASTPGYKLVWLISQEIAASNTNMVEVAEQIKISQGTFSHPGTGKRSASRLERPAPFRP